MSIYGGPPPNVPPPPPSGGRRPGDRPGTAAPIGYWDQKGGVRIAIADMTDDHLLNTLHMLKRWAVSCSEEYWLDFLAGYDKWAELFGEAVGRNYSTYVLADLMSTPGGVPAVPSQMFDGGSITPFGVEPMAGWAEKELPMGWSAEEDAETFAVRQALSGDSLRIREVRAPFLPESLYPKGGLVIKESDMPTMSMKQIRERAIVAYRELWGQTKCCSNQSLQARVDADLRVIVACASCGQELLYRNVEEIVALGPKAQPDRKPSGKRAPRAPRVDEKVQVRPTARVAEPKPEKDDMLDRFSNLLLDPNDKKR